MLSYAPRVSSTQEYTVEIRQEPDRGRMCGFTNMPDKRILDPPLVVQLSFKGSDNDEMYTKLNNTFLCHVTLSLPESPLCASVIQKSRGSSLSSRSSSKVSKKSDRQPSNVSILFGTTIVNGVVMNDFHSGKKTMYFVFPDLSVRIQGDFRLRVHVIDMACPGKRHSPIYTSPFTVFSPKLFPGMLVSSGISNHLYLNGIPIRRREYSVTNYLKPQHLQQASDSLQEMGIEDDEEEEDPDSSHSSSDTVLNVSLEHVGSRPKSAITICQQQMLIS